MKSASFPPLPEVNDHSQINPTTAMPKSPKKTAARTKSTTPTQQRLWLMYPPRLIKKPFIWEVGHKFKVVTNIRQASVTDEIGIVCLELDGPRDEVKAAIKWLEKNGVNVEPVEINVIES
ncbi:MAG TPA: NIL domain-containing protein [Verrucomicrobiae bacterium]|nr:NIL domain-containing protein [Verrucomicrobiae bacterium]